MNILEQITFEQPSGDRIILRRLETPFYPPYSCERLVRGERLECHCGIDRKWTDKYMKDWSEFEKRIGSKLL